MKRHCLIATLGTFVAVAVSRLAYGSSELTTFVVSTGTYGNGNVFVELANALDEAACPIRYIELPAESPSAKATLASATAALMSGAAVKVKTDGCLGGVPTLTNARSSYFQLGKP
jgi:hypothetical protein